MINKIINNKFLAIILVYLITLLAFSNIFNNQFILDDFDFIVHWPLIQDWSNFSQFFVDYVPPAGQEGIYSPIKTLFHAINYYFFKQNPFGYHVISLLIHFISILFVYQISFLLLKSMTVSFLCALFFAVHPVQVEAITYMTASVDMIGILFLFAAFYSYIRSQKSKMLERKFYFISVILAFLAVFTHELAISLPLLFLWHDITLNKNRLKGIKYIFSILPFFVLVGLYSLIKYLVLGEVTRGNYVLNNFYLTALIMVKAWAKYVYICFWPWVLTHNQVIAKGIYSFDPTDFDKFAVLSQSIFEPLTFLALIMLGGIIFLASRSYRNNPLITFSIGWYFISLLPVSNIIPSGVYFGERYLYPGLFGFCLLLAFFYEYVQRNKESPDIVQKALTSFIIILVLFYCNRTWIRNKDWKNEITFFESAVRANPNSALMRNDLGIIYSEYQEYEKALKSFEEALKIKKDPVTYFVMADVYVRLKQQKKAMDALNEAVALNPEYAEAYYNMAGIYAVWGMLTQAQDNLEKAIFYLNKQNRTKEAKELQKAFEDYFFKDKLR